ncbi:hypothetical protein Tco_0024739 [Tanacetum coccineum]
MWIDCLTALEMKYDTWVLDQDMIPVEAEFFLNSAKLDSVVDFYVGERLGLLFARSSGSGIWTNHFVNEFAQMHESNLSNDEDGFGFWARKVNFEEVVAKKELPNNTSKVIPMTEYSTRAVEM